jgi:hypothetical protein
MGEMTGPDAARPPRRNHTAGYRVFEGEATIVLPDGSYIKVLNETGSRIWELLDGSRGVKEIASVIAGEYEITPEAAERDVREFLEELGRHRMLE